MEVGRTARLFVRDISEPIGDLKVPGDSRAVLTLLDQEPLDAPAEIQYGAEWAAARLDASHGVKEVMRRIKKKYEAGLPVVTEIDLLGNLPRRPAREWLRRMTSLLVLRILRSSPTARGSRIAANAAMASSRRYGSDKIARAGFASRNAERLEASARAAGKLLALPGVSAEDVRDRLAARDAGLENSKLLNKIEEQLCKRTVKLTLP